MIARRLVHVESSEDIVLDGFENVPLHQGNMLVGGGVEDDGGLILAHQVGQAGGVLNTADFGVESEVGEGLADLALQMKNRRFRDIETDQRGRGETRHLAADFRADRTRGAGHQDGSAPQLGGDAVGFESNGNTAQKVFDRHIANGAGQVDRVVNQFGKPGDGLVGNLRGGAVFDNSLDLRAGGGGHGDQQQLGVMFLDDVDKAGALAE